MLHLFLTLKHVLKSLKKGSKDDLHENTYILAATDPQSTHPVTQNVDCIAAYTMF